MRRLQFYLPEDVDDRLEAEAARSNTSKAALIRSAIDARYGAGVANADPVEGLIGALDGRPRARGESVDDVVYGS